MVLARRLVGRTTCTAFAPSRPSRSTPRRLGGMRRCWPACIEHRAGRLRIAGDPQTLINRHSRHKAVKKPRFPPPADTPMGAVAFIHRFGSSLNTHVHFDVCVVDGVFEALPDGVAIHAATFRPRAGCYLRPFCAGTWSSTSGLVNTDTLVGAELPGHAAVARLPFLLNAPPDAQPMAVSRYPAVWLQTCCAQCQYRVGATKRERMRQQDVARCSGARHVGHVVQITLGVRLIQMHGGQGDVVL